MIYVFFGLIASGKSTLAELFAGKHGLPCYNTDRVRKELARIDPTERRPDRMNQGIYTPQFTQKTYQAMLDRAAEDLQQGAGSVVLDGSYSTLADRDKVVKLAKSSVAEPLFILCGCSDEEVKRRLELRAQDPNAVSDGRWEIYIKQKEKFIFPDELPENQRILLDTEAEPEQLLAQLNDRIDQL